MLQLLELDGKRVLKWTWRSSWSQGDHRELNDAEAWNPVVAWRQGSQLENVLHAEPLKLRRKT